MDWHVVTYADADADIGHNPRFIYEYRPTPYLCRGEVTKATVLDPVEPPPPPPPSSSSHDYIRFQCECTAQDTANEDDDPSFPVPMYSYASPHNLRTFDQDNDSSGTTSMSTCPQCGTAYNGTWAARNLVRHREVRHFRSAGSGSVDFACPVAGCGSVFRRGDALKEHVQRSHAGYLVHNLVPRQERG
jgi:uncharacterized C2H2 Zn-finger protein